MEHCIMHSRAHSAKPQPVHRRAIARPTNTGAGTSNTHNTYENQCKSKRQMGQHDHKNDGEAQLQSKTDEDDDQDYDDEPINI